MERQRNSNPVYWLFMAEPCVVHLVVNTNLNGVAEFPAWSLKF